jgi:uncharacterized membrane protein YidH (DUF202 family)
LRDHPQNRSRALDTQQPEAIRAARDLIVTLLQQLHGFSIRTARGQPQAIEEQLQRTRHKYVESTTPPNIQWYPPTHKYHAPPGLTHPPGKRIALPTRVEPKVFFANERTFLSWLNFTVILGGLAVGLLNFGDSVGRISAGLFTLVAMAAMIYALFTFHWRAKSIRQRGQGGFDDRIGPSVLALALLAAVVVNFVLRVVEA